MVSKSEAMFHVLKISHGLYLITSCFMIIRRNQGLVPSLRICLIQKLRDKQRQKWWLESIETRTSWWWWCRKSKRNMQWKRHEIHKYVHLFPNWLYEGYYEIQDISRHGIFVLHFCFVFILRYILQTKVVCRSILWLYHCNQYFTLVNNHDIYNVSILVTSLSLSLFILQLLICSRKFFFIENKIGGCTDHVSET